MKIIGIDYGDKKTGIAFAEGSLAEPLQVIYHENPEEFIIKMFRLVEIHKPEKLVVGMPGREQGEKVKQVIELLKKDITLPVEVVDEQFSTLEAQYLSREGGVPRKKRKSMEDAYSAAIILQKYLDSN